MSRPASAASRGDRPAFAVESPNEARSAPAENDRPWPVTITTLTRGWLSNHRAASASSSRVVVPRGFSFSGRSRVRRPMGPSTVARTVVSSGAGTESPSSPAR